MAQAGFDVHAEWDEEARVWYVARSDVPGLSAEAATTEALLDKLRILVPELLELNRHLLKREVGADVSIHLTT